MLNIFFASQTGNAENLAHVIGGILQDNGIPTTVRDMGECDPETISQYSPLLIVASTHGDGEPPENGSEWMSYLKFTDQVSLEKLHYAVLGLGDTYYPHFCQCGKDFDLYLSQHGARPLVPRLDCDLYYEEQYGEWLEQLIAVLKKDLK